MNKIYLYRNYSLEGDVPVDEKEVTNLRRVYY